MGSQRHTSQRGQWSPAGGGYWHTGGSQMWKYVGACSITADVSCVSSWRSRT
jgi:hypothetical protein